jgi:hypothetical protein
LPYHAVLNKIAAISFGLMEMSINNLKQLAKFVLVLVYTGAFSSVHGQIRRATTIDGTIDEMVKLLKAKKDRIVIRDYAVSSAPVRLSKAEVDDALTRFRLPGKDPDWCDGKSLAGQLEVTLIATKGLEEQSIPRKKLWLYNFPKSAAAYDWVRLNFDTKPCQHGRDFIYFVKIGRYWYMRN